MTILQKQHQLQTACTLYSPYFYTQYGQFRKEIMIPGSTTFNTLWPDDHQPLLTLAIETRRKTPDWKEVEWRDDRTQQTQLMEDMTLHTWNRGGKQTSTYKQEQKVRNKKSWQRKKTMNRQEPIQNNSTEKYEPCSLQQKTSTSIF